MVTLHVAGLDKFIPPFIKLMRDNFSLDKHIFFVYGGNPQLYPLQSDANCRYVDAHKYIRNIKLLAEMFKANKIILHGLFEMDVIRLLMFNPILLSKCYWVIWGGDLYRKKIVAVSYKSKLNDFCLKFVIKRLGHLVTCLDGDIQLARKWYSARGIGHECIMYPSNVYSALKLPPKSTKSKTILIGNSANPTNNHDEILNKLVKLEDQNFKIICPLSYGNKEHAKKIAALGKSFFGDRFIPLIDFMVFNEYLKILAEVDIAIFAHKRQQGMGNTITLLGLGKKVYMRNDVTPFALFKKLNIEVFDVDNINFDQIKPEVINRNVENIKKYFSKENLLIQLNGIFNIE